MTSEIIPFAGWDRNLRLANDHAELIVTLDVGPRILSYGHPASENVFKNFPEQLGGSHEEEFLLRGGHRLWVAPEDAVRSYHFDNQPVDFTADESTGEIEIGSLQTCGGRIHKTLGILMTGNGPEVVVRHTVRNDGDEPIRIASWALSVMQPGGMEIIPQPPLGEHPRDLLPNRGLVLWPYTDMSDPRWNFGRRFFTLRQSEGFEPTKLGLAHREKWVAYLIGDSIFIKSFDLIEGQDYPDGGCNFETFTNSEMLEIESLSPLATLSPGEAVSHSERWFVFPVPGEALIESEGALARWLQPFLNQTEP